MILGDDDLGARLIVVEHIEATEILDMSGGAKSVARLLEVALGTFDSEGRLGCNDLDIVVEVLAGDIEVDAAVIEAEGRDIDAAVVERLEEGDPSEPIDGDDLALPDAEHDAGTEAGLELGRSREGHADGGRSPLGIRTGADANNPLESDNGCEIGTRTVLHRLGLAGLLGDGRRRELGGLLGVAGGVVTLG
ncbi:MAG: hypothetical protein EA380_11995 [Phycisphaeraceae bacterium]|nr:MAG: hypothetical protein EA380_11995 [Phycisphaeraceae bacterium]